MTERSPNGWSDETMSIDEAREHLRHGATMSDADVRAYRSVVMLHLELAVQRAKLATAEQRAEHAEDITRAACETWPLEATDLDTEAA